MKARVFLVGVLLWCASVSVAFAQCGGQAASGYACGNGAASTGSPGFYPLATLLDRGFGSGTGTILNRSGSGWVATIAPTLGLNGGTGGSITLNGSTSGAATISVPAAAGSVTFQLPSTNGSPNFILQTDGSGHLSWTAAGGGTVSSVGLSMPSIFAVTGSPVTSTGTLTASLNTQSTNTVWAGPSSGVAAAPTFRALVGADLPAPTTSSLGGVQANNAINHEWINAINTSGVPQLSQPSFADISGTAAGSQLPTPSATTLGGVESYASVSHQWINSISTAGVPSSTQPAFTDIAGSAALTQLPSISSNSVLGNNSGVTSSPSGLSASNVFDMIGNVQGDVLYRGASGWSVLAPGTAGQVLATGGASANPSWATIGGTGTVTQINAGAGIALSPSPITTTGTVSLASIATGNILANVSGVSAAPSATTPSAVLDSIGSGTGSVLYRGAATWSALAPGSNGQMLVMGASTPSWQSVAPAIDAGGATSITNGGSSGNLLYNNAGKVGSATPSGFWDSLCSTTVGQIWVRETGGWGCTSLGYANPVWWGASSGGSATTNSSAIASAIAASNVVELPPGGTYQIASAIQLEPNQRFTCNGSTVTQPNGANLAHLIDIFTNTPNSAQLDHCVLDGNWANNTTNSSVELVDVSGANNVSVLWNTIKNSPGGGVSVAGEYPIVEHNTFTNTYAAPIGVVGAVAGAQTWASIRFNDIEGPYGNDAIYAYQSDHDNISDNVINPGLVIGGAGSAMNVTISGTTATWVSGVNFSGAIAGQILVVNGGSEFTITAVNSTTSLTLATSGTLTNVPAAIGSADVISLNNISFGKVTGNLILGGATGGIVLSNATSSSENPIGNLISDNITQDTGEFGISVSGYTESPATNVTNTSLVGNVVANPGRDGSAGSSVDAIEISGASSTCNGLLIDGNYSIDQFAQTGGYWLTGGGSANCTNVHFGSNRAQGFTNNQAMQGYPTFASLPVAALGYSAYIIDGLAAQCGDGTCTTWGTNVAAGGGALKLHLWYDGSNWTLVGK